MHGALALAPRVQAVDEAGLLGTGVAVGRSGDLAHERAHAMVDRTHPARAQRALHIGEQDHPGLVGLVLHPVHEGLVEHHVLAVDRKSTRLNSSHPSISYAVFCLKKKIYRTLAFCLFLPCATLSSSSSSCN